MRELPEILTRQMAVPVAHWIAGQCAVVLFLDFTQGNPTEQPWAVLATFARDGQSWAAHKGWCAIGWPCDPLSPVHRPYAFEDHVLQRAGGSHARAPVPPGDPAIVACGLAAPEVTQIEVVQDGHETRRRLDRQLDAWVVCIEMPVPYEIKALDDAGQVLDTLRGD